MDLMIPGVKGRKETVDSRIYTNCLCNLIHTHSLVVSYVWHLFCGFLCFCERVRAARAWSSYLSMKLPVILSEYDSRENNTPLHLSLHLAPYLQASLHPQPDSMSDRESGREKVIKKERCSSIRKDEGKVRGRIKKHKGCSRISLSKIM